MTGDGRRGVPAQVLFGGLLLGLGLLLLLRNIGWLDGGVWRFWPLLLVAVGSLKLLTAITPFDRLLGAALIAFGGLRMAAAFFGLAIRPVDILALVLVVFGAAITWRGLRGCPPLDSRDAADARDYISALAFLGGYAPRCSSQQFRGGDVTVFMGGVNIDLRASSMQAPAVLDVFVMWGGVEVRVPDDWTVELRGTPILAGFEDKTRPQPGSSDKRLILRGVAVMGGIEIKN